MSKDIIKIAAEYMKVATDIAEKHYKEIPEINAYYFWNPVRGGIAVIVNSEGEALGATSSVSFDRHLEEFKKGRRN